MAIRDFNVKEMYEKWVYDSSTQVIISNLFSFFFLLLVIPFLLKGKILHPCLIVYLISIALFLFTRIKKQSIRIFQGYLVLVEGCLALYLDNKGSNIYGYGLLFIGISLLLYYGYFKRYAILKSCLITLLLILCFVLSAIKTDNRTLIYSAIICIPCILLCEFIIWRKTLFRVSERGENLKELSESLAIREAEIQEREEYLKELEEQHNNKAKELQRHIEVAKNKVSSDENRLKKRLTVVLKEEDFKSDEFDLIFLFYSHRGSFTNKELSETMNIKEQSVKNIMSRVYKKLNVRSRTEMLVELDSRMLSK